MNNATVNLHVHIFVWTYVFISLEYIPMSRMITARLCAKVAVPFHIPTGSVGGLRFHPILHLLAACCYVLFIAAILLGVKWYLTVALISLGLLTSNNSAVFWGYEPVRPGWAPLLLTAV